MKATRQNQLLDSDEPLALIGEGVVRSLWMAALAVFGLGRLLVRAPVLALALASSTAVIWFVGWRWAIAAGGVVALALLLWRLTNRSSFARYAAPHLTHAWRGPLYRAWFPHVARRCGLSVSEHGWSPRERREAEVARLLRVQFKGTGVERLLIRLPIGMTPEDVALRAQAVGQAFGARSVRVVNDRPGRVWLEFQRLDPLERDVRPIAGMRTALHAVVVGLADDLSPWNLRIQGTHTLIAGATGAGKGSVLWSMVHGLSEGIEQGWVEVWAIDPKGGMELGLGQKAFQRFEGGSPDAMCDLLEELVDLKTRRSMALSTAGLRRHEPRPDSPHIVIVVDELATLTAFAERTVVRRIDQALGLLLTQGRAVGISVVAAVQDPGKDVVSWRDLFPTRVAMRLDNPIQVDMVLGDGARERGALADHISEHLPGVAYVRVEGTREIKRVRAAYLDDDEVQALAARIDRARTRRTAPEGAAA